MNKYYILLTVSMLALVITERVNTMEQETGSMKIKLSYHSTNHEQTFDNDEITVEQMLEEMLPMLKRVYPAIKSIHSVDDIEITYTGRTKPIKHSKKLNKLEDSHLAITLKTTINSKIRIETPFIIDMGRYIPKEYIIWAHMLTLKDLAESTGFTGFRTSQVEYGLSTPLSQLPNNCPLIAIPHPNQITQVIVARCFPYFTDTISHTVYKEISLEQYKQVMGIYEEEGNYQFFKDKDGSSFLSGEIKLGDIATAAPLNLILKKVPDDKG